ncbi:MAG: anti-sigma factor family protein [Acidimicrobiales bacterium]
MPEDLSHGDIQELLGAYCLDAVDERERATVEAHLKVCESCRSELDDHRRDNATHTGAAARADGGESRGR